jgi:hypothetical protein
MTRRWLALAFLACAAITAAFLPPNPPGVRSGGDEPAVPSSEARASLLAVRLRRLALADSLSARVTTAAAAGETLTILDRIPPPVSLISGWQRELGGLASRGQLEPGVALGILRTTSSDLRRSDPYADELRLRLVRSPLMALAGRRHGRTWCVTVDVPAARRGGPRLDGELSEVMGPCWFVGRYGLPGPGVATWLGGDAGVLAWATAATAELPTARTRWRALGQLPESGLGTWITSGLRPTRNLRVNAERCLSGDEPVCASLVAQAAPSIPLSIQNRRLPRDAGVLSVEDPGWIGTPLPGVVDGNFLQRLEARFGPHAFRAFWTSTLPLEDAFAEAFGTSLGAYVRTRGQEVYGAVRPGPRPGMAGWTGLVLALIVGAGVGILVSGRRKAG